MLTIVAILLFNMLIVKRFIGGVLLSDGTHIKHRGKAEMWPTSFPCSLSLYTAGHMVLSHAQAVVYI